MIFTDHAHDAVFKYIEGTIGVQVFFIISGFVMSFTTRHLTASPLENFKDFAIKRAIRIFPLFYFAVLLTILVNHATLSLIFNDHLSTLIRVLLFQPTFINNQGPYFGLWLLPTVWTLNYEMLFYALFAISLIAGRFRYYALYSLLLVFVVVVPLILTHQFSFSPDVNYPFTIQYLSFITNPIILLFLSGLLLAYLLPKVKLSKTITLVFFVLSTIIFILYIRRILPVSPINNILACTLLVAAVILVDMQNLFAPPKWLIYLGNMSFSVYILHMVFFTYLPMMFEQKLSFLNLKDSWLQVAIIFIIVFVFSAITYELIEMRFTNYLKDKLFTRKTRL
ncbi:acyltransferase [Mucilaginibacter sp. CSA2-8R]|uniref:acyltransferase family protein n=1 Tax=Mucilaginibacter sp. CSA2-8R TaxID=3141542 RepID=UPI00315D7559